MYRRRSILNKAVLCSTFCKVQDILYFQLTDPNRT